MHEQKRPFTQADLERSFRELGVAEGMMLEVHSSLSSLGCVEGGAEAVVHTLMSIVGSQGALVMPSQPVSAPLPLTDADRQRGVTYKIKVLSEDSTERTGMGAIADAFRMMPDVRTGTGPHRVSAWGKDVEENSKRFGHLIEMDGRALLIGVDIYRLSSMHYMEAKLPDKVRSLYEAPADVLKLYPQDEWYVQTGSPPVKAWYTIQDEAHRRGLIREGLVGESKCMFFKLNDVIRIYEKAIETDPYALFGITP